MKRISYPVSILLLIILGPMAVAENWNLRDHIPLEKVMVQCHRGAGALSPENSVEAFGLAWQWNTIPELDLRMTKDGVIVAFHDNNFKRILPDAAEELQNKGIADLTLEEVKKLDIGIWKGKEFEGQRVPTLAETLELMKKDPKRMIYIDIKNVDFEQLARETKGFHPRLILASTKNEEIRLWKKLAPTSMTLHWMGGSEEAIEKRFVELRKTNFVDITQLQIHVLIDKDSKLKPSEEFLKKTGIELRKHGVTFQTLPLECRDATVFKRLMDLGCASFATDYPDTTMTAIREYYAEKK